MYTSGGHTNNKIIEQVGRISTIIFDKKKQLTVTYMLLIASCYRKEHIK